MKLTKSKLKQIIKEELRGVLQEGRQKWCVQYVKDGKPGQSIVVYAGDEYDSKKIKREVVRIVQSKKRLKRSDIKSAKQGACPPQKAQRLDEQGKCRPLKGAYKLLWDLLKTHSRNPAMRDWRRDLKSDTFCPERADVMPAAETLISALGKYWQQTAPLHLACKGKSEAEMSDDDPCINLAEIQKLELKTRKRALKHPKRALMYIQNFAGSFETARITQKYCVVDC